MKDREQDREEKRKVDGEGHGDGDAEDERKVMLVKLPAQSSHITKCPNGVAYLTS